MNDIRKIVSAAIARIRSGTVTSIRLRRRLKRGKVVKVTIRNVASEAGISYSTIYRHREEGLLPIKRIKKPSSGDTAALEARIRKLTIEKHALIKALRDLATKATYWRLAHDKIAHALKKDKRREKRIRESMGFD